MSVAFIHVYLISAIITDLLYFIWYLYIQIVFTVDVYIHIEPLIVKIMLKFTV